MTTTTRPNTIAMIALARRQHWAIAHRQLLERGWSLAAIRHARRRGVLHTVHRGVYAVGRPHLTREGHWMAAVLAAGPVAGLSHEPGALLLRLLERGDERPHVTVPSHDGRGPRAGYTVHRSRILGPDDFIVRNGIPVTTVPRTLWDLSDGRRPIARVRAAVRQAVRVHHVDLVTLWGLVDGRGDRRSLRLRRVLALYVPREELTESELEVRFLELSGRAGFPPPDLQRRVGERRADFLWNDCRLIVETDGRDHLTPIALRDDKAKDLLLQLKGYAVIRFTWADVVNRPVQTTRELHAHRARRFRELGLARR
jgi:Protein of unknown function (DUF559)